MLYTQPFLPILQHIFVLLVSTKQSVITTTYICIRKTNWRIQYCACTKPCIDSAHETPTNMQQQVKYFLTIQMLGKKENPCNQTHLHRSNMSVLLLHRLWHWLRVCTLCVPAHDKLVSPNFDNFVAVC